MSAGGHGPQIAAQPVAPLPVPPVQYTVGPAGFAPPSSPPPRAISSTPPAVYAPLGSTPPSGAPNPPRPRTPLDDPSMSMPMVARRPWGLILVVLLIDVGLAVAGGVMLSRGFGYRTTTAPRTGASMTPPSAVATGAGPSEPGPKPNSDPTPAAPGPEPGSGTTPNGSPIEGSISSGHGGAAPDPGGKRPRRRHGGAGNTSGPPGGPVDPYDTPAPSPDPLPPEAR